MPAALIEDIDEALLHGSVCGLLCGAPDLSQEAALRDLARLLRASVDDSAGELTEYVEQCRASLAADDFNFRPRLGEDDVLVSVRIEALRSWCEGFLSGYALSEPMLDEAAEEALADVTAIAALDADDADADDVEVELAQVEEHLKIAVLLIHDTVRAGQEAQPDADE